MIAYVLKHSQLLLKHGTAPVLVSLLETSHDEVRATSW